MATRERLGGLPPISELDAQRYDVQAGAELADTYDQVLKHGESFAVFDRHGDILPEGMGEEGLYHRGTRHVSGLVLRLAGHRPLLLGSTAKRDNSRLAFDLTNTDLGRGPAAAAPQQRAPVPHQGAVGWRLPRAAGGAQLCPRAGAPGPDAALPGGLRRSLRSARHASRGARPRPARPRQRTGSGAALRRPGRRDSPHPHHLLGGTQPPRAR